MAPESVSFDRAADYYDQTRGFPPGIDAEVAARFVEAGRLTASSRVLEIGVGTGRIAVPLAQRVGSYVGIDLSAPMLGRLRGKESAKPVRVVQGDITALPYPSRAFDAVVAVHIFHLVPGWREALREVARVLKPGGLLLHGSGSRSSDAGLDAVWRSAINSPPVTSPHGTESDFPDEEGWSPAGDLMYEYPTLLSPQTYLDSIRNRVWSSTWSMSDEDLEAGYQALQVYINQHYPDTGQPVTTMASFRIRAYQPPQQL